MLQALKKQNPKCDSDEAFSYRPYKDVRLRASGEQSPITAVAVTSIEEQCRCSESKGTSI
jgi:hypothetical protein